MKKILNNSSNNTTEMVFILDRSGSMSGLEGDTIGGFNAMIEKQKKQDGKAYVTTILFDNESEVIHDRVPLEDIKPLTENEYYVRGCTALIDALGGAIKHISTIHKYARATDVPDNTIFVITTDGQENASHSFSSKEVKKMIKKQTEKHGWDFLFLGANIDAIETAKTYGIHEDHAVNYHADKRGTRKIFEGVSNAVSACRVAAPICAEWKADIEEDYNNR